MHVCDTNTSLHFSLLRAPRAAKETEDCGETPCPVDCEANDWSDWSHCVPFCAGAEVRFASFAFGGANGFRSGGNEGLGPTVIPGRLSLQGRNVSTAIGHLPLMESAFFWMAAHGYQWEASRNTESATRF